MYLLRGVSRRFFVSEAVAAAHKEHEGRMELRCAAGEPLLARLDGHRFSQFTRAFHKPYDWRVVRAMRGAAGDLLTHFSPACVFTQSDEITLLFAPQDTGHPFAGKVEAQKMSSLLAGFCSVRFAHHLRQLVPASDTRLHAKIDTAHFDARIFNVPSARDVLDNLRWRQDDCRRNSVNTVGSLYFSPRQLFGVRPQLVCDMLRNTSPGIVYEDYHPHFKLGCLLKKQSFRKPYVNPLTKEAGTIERTRVACAYMDLRRADNAIEIVNGPRVPDFANDYFFSIDEPETYVLPNHTVRQVFVASSLEGRPGWKRLMALLKRCDIPVVKLNGNGLDASQLGSALCIVDSDVDAAAAFAAQAACVVQVSSALLEQVITPQSWLKVPAISYILPQAVGLPEYEANEVHPKGAELKKEVD